MSGLSKALVIVVPSGAYSVTRQAVRLGFLPHLTIAYADRMLPEAVPIAPVTSRAVELVLLASRSGQPHEALERWTLRA